MRIESQLFCDRCGINVNGQYEFILEKYSHTRGSYRSSPYDTVGGYCKQCGYLINEAANINRMREVEKND